MRSVHVIPSVEEEASGPSSSVPRLCRELIDLNVDVRLHSLGTADGGLGSWDVRHPRWSVLYKLGISPRLKAALIAEAITADLLHGHSLWMLPNIYPRVAGLRAGKPWVISPRGTLSPWALERRRWSKRILWTWAQGAVVREAALLHASSDQERRDFRDLGLKNPVAVIPNGIDLPVAQGPETKAGLRRLLFLGRVHPTKGVELLLEAWGACHRSHPDWELVVAGPGEADYVETLRHLSSQAGLERISFPGAVYGVAKDEMYRSAELSVLPSHSESFGMAVAEALAHSIPVVVSRETPWQDVEKIGCGRWIERDARKWAEVLRELMGRPPHDLAAMGTAGRNWMASAYSWRSVAERMKKSYEWVLGGGAPPPWIET